MSDEMKVKRFNPDICCGAGVGTCGEFMSESADGEYVRYTDYATLQQQLAAAREALARSNELIAKWRYAAEFCGPTTTPGRMTFDPASPFP